MGNFIPGKQLINEVFLCFLLPRLKWVLWNSSKQYLVEKIIGINQDTMLENLILICLKSKLNSWSRRRLFLRTSSLSQMFSAAMHCFQNFRLHILFKRGKMFYCFILYSIILLWNWFCRIIHFEIFSFLNFFLFKYLYKNNDQFTDLSLIRTSSVYVKDCTYINIAARMSIFCLAFQDHMAESVYNQYSNRLLRKSHIRLTT